MKRVVFAWLLTLILCAAPFALAGETARSAAFGEALSETDEATRAACLSAAEAALSALLSDIWAFAETYGIDGYAEVLHTTVFLMPDALPDGVTDTERKIWDSNKYQDIACIVKFVVLDNTMTAENVSYAEVSGRFPDYAVMRDGSVAPITLHHIRMRVFAEPVLPGMRVINLGGAMNGVFTH